MPSTKHAPMITTLLKDNPSMPEDKALEIAFTHLAVARPDDFPIPDMTPRNRDCRVCGKAQKKIGEICPTCLAGVCIVQQRLLGPTHVDFLKTDPATWSQEEKENLDKGEVLEGEDGKEGVSFNKMEERKEEEAHFSGGIGDGIKGGPRMFMFPTTMAFMMPFGHI